MHFFKSALSLDEFESNNSFAVGLVYLCPDKHLAAASSRRGPGLAGDSGSMHRPDENDDDQIAVAILVGQNSQDQGQNRLGPPRSVALLAQATLVRNWFL